jgi:hypothetical protein
MADYLELLDWIEARDLTDAVDPVQLAVRLLVPPGSLLLELDEVRAAIGPLDPARLTYRWTHPDSRMEALEPAVFACVAEAARQGEPGPVTLARVARLARAAAEGTALDAGDAPPRRASRPPPPRLTESWFC